MKILIFILIGFSIGLHAQRPSAPYLGSSRKFLDTTAIHKKVDSIMWFGIKERAFPGAQLLVAKNNGIVFHKAYGHHTYDSLIPVGKNDLYDLASVTKITGPLPALMKLVDEKKLDLDIPFSNYWKPWKKRKDKRELTLREILAHQAGLIPYIVFQEKVTRKKGSIKKRFIKKVTKEGYTHELYKGLYVKDDFDQKMYRVINRSKVDQEKKYRYSGLTFLIYPELIGQLTGMPYQHYLRKNFYDPMGCTSLGFLPKKRGLTNTIVPTEIDSTFRKTLVQGWVHDENAALLGGISGNAGLFGTAKDLYKMMQLYQNYGVFQGKRYLSEAVVREFTSIQYPENDNRRGLGFDKPLLGNDSLPLADAYPSPKSSPTSFGHSGFTGTFVWADPENQLVFIFLSNRVYPDRSHRKLYDLHIRTALHNVFYSAIP